MIWLKYGKDEPVVPIVTFYPPDGRNSAEVGVDYSDKASSKETASLIVYLASKGYIQIDEKENNNFILTKLKDYDGKKSSEKKMMKALFEEKDVISKRSLELSSIFYQDCEEIENQLNERYKTKLFDKNTVTPQRVITFLCCIAGIAIMTVYSLNNYSFDFISLGDDLYAYVTFLFVGGVLFVSAFSDRPKRFYQFVLLLFWILIFVYTTVYLLFKELNFSIDLPVFLTGVAGLIVSVICLINLPKSNKKGRKVLGEVLGLKKFLEVAKKEEIEKLVQENPNYCYDILPFAYVFGVTDVWIKKFEEIQMEEPTWYSGSIYNFSNIISTIKSTTIPSIANVGITYSSGGSGSSGGGFSGGGGGGSW